MWAPASGGHHAGKCLQVNALGANGRRSSRIAAWPDAVATLVTTGRGLVAGIFKFRGGPSRGQPRAGVGTFSLSAWVGGQRFHLMPRAVRVASHTARTA